MGLIGKIYPASSKGHSFIIVATDFFTKWVEALPLKKAEQGNVINFVKENIINRFGIPEMLTTDQGTMFTGSDMREFAEHYGIKLRNSSQELDELRIQAYNALLLQKQRVARIYNKRVSNKSFHAGEMVWKAILPLGTKDRKLDKWSPNWEGPFKVHKILDRNPYWLSSLDDQPHKRFTNGKYLKPYFPSMREAI
ncbi:uncharacterized protein LOC142541877 [Primulina tabacum]|uniref:uncharacterized protein LOC142541877 n=1 Tax=Primulina tabacum TaxID=48773 RepID=UPI003F5A8D52